MENRTEPVEDSQAELDRLQKLVREFYETHSFDAPMPVDAAITATREWEEEDE